MEGGNTMRRLTKGPLNLEVCQLDAVFLQMDLFVFEQAEGGLRPLLVNLHIMVWGLMGLVVCRSGWWKYAIDHLYVVNAELAVSGGEGWSDRCVRHDL